MEINPTRRVQSRKRKPFSDITNTFNSHSSSSLPFKPNALPSPFNKTSAKRISSTNPSNPTSPILSLHGTSDVEASRPISISYSPKRDSNQRKDKGKGVAFSISSTPNLQISNTWEKSGRVDGANVPKTKPLPVPLRKKHHSISPEEDVLKDPELQDFIKKQIAYFKAIDEFELSEEEVESGDELD
ncbi:PREDICTED: uncharacterized protein LOC109359512 [Lupinus angustifolius]|uniref:uncharacterized protein LOC109359512 n=1 Tax=Lupinus angustifolius TaxID=3871 RepID=UPI00092F0DB7|nr:PREDICTED: uncharacterized protein LOC109359512 [Lupinus angustifolius]